MKAIVACHHTPISDPAAFQTIELPDPVPTGHDLLVKVEAISVNPVDTKVRRGLPEQPGEPHILGWDAAGVVQAVGDQVTLFRPGDRVWYAGNIQRAGSNAELQLVDERIVGHMPNSLSFTEAAALPLTAITAWELLFDRLQLQRGGHQGEALMIVGAAGGVGSVLIQLARQLTGLTVVATAYHSSQPWPFPSQLMIGLIAEVSDDQARPDQTELEAVAWLTRAEARAVIAGDHPTIQPPPPFAIAHNLIKAWAEEG